MPSIYNVYVDSDSFTRDKQGQWKQQAKIGLNIDDGNLISITSGISDLDCSKMVPPKNQFPFSWKIDMKIERWTDQRVNKMPSVYFSHHFAYSHSIFWSINECDLTIWAANLLMFQREWHFTNLSD